MTLFVVIISIRKQKEQKIVQSDNLIESRSLS